MSKMTLSAAQLRVPEKEGYLLDHRLRRREQECPIGEHPTGHALSLKTGQ